MIEGRSQERKATASMALGIVAMVGLLVPGVGIPFAVAGLVLGVRGLRSSVPSRARAGIIMCSLGLSLAVVALATMAWGVNSGFLPGDAFSALLAGRAVAVLAGMGAVLEVFWSPLRRFAHRNPHDRLWSAVYIAVWVGVAVFFLHRGWWDLAAAWGALALYGVVRCAVAFGCWKSLEKPASVATEP